MKFFLDCIAVLRTAELMVEVFRIAFGEDEETFIIVPYKIFLTFVLELDLSLMDFMKSVLKPTKKFLW